jgi:hypothetical protein
MNMITGFSPSIDSKAKVYDIVLVIVNKFPKMVKYFPTQKTLNAVQLADLFCKTIVKDFGIPRFIVSDRGTVFMSQFWLSLCFYMKAK